MPRPARRATGNTPIRFDKRLVLNRWFLSLFGASTLEELARDLKDSRYEGYDENNRSHFHNIIVARLFPIGISKEQLLKYDENIFSHTKRINERREMPVKWKYFQYLALLATDIYLERWFENPQQLCDDLNEFRDSFNQEVGLANAIDPFTVEGLSKLAFWSATGSGKTLLMHVHLLQFQHYARLKRVSKNFNKFILITPNEGLSKQHLDELHASNIPARLFTKGSSMDTLFAAYGNEKPLEIIEYTKLREESKEKTVAIESFEDNNLVFVDEGHKGAGGDVIKEYRDTLSVKGFVFEYSATFGQSITAAAAGRREQLRQEYAKAILFDYSYRYFYNDGYGKDYRILNLAEVHAANNATKKLYLTAALLSFYQQVKLFENTHRQLQAYEIERPLWVFVGGKVTAVRTEQGQKVSDVVDILLFLKDFTSDRASAIASIRSLMKGEAGLTDATGREIFSDAFTYIQTLGLAPEALYDDALSRVFRSSGGQLRLENIKSAEGEIGVRLGEAPQYFGVINVGDDKKLLELCEGNGLQVTEQAFESRSLFNEINRDDSPINILIGSKKFTEGWSSWRVSLMGLMNIGRSEGSEIIQLFGRGVRLKGKHFSLKRSRALEGTQAPQNLRILETLSIFGVRADYMASFKEYLKEEGLPPDDSKEIILPVVKSYDIKTGLKVLRVKDGTNFKKDGGIVNLEYVKDPRLKLVELDMYPRLEAIAAGVNLGTISERNTAALTADHIAFFNIDSLYFELLRFKNERNWFNVNISRENIEKILKEQGWYVLYIPQHALTFDGYSRVTVWQEMALSLLKKYLVSLYNFRKSEWEQPFLQYEELTAEDPNFFEQYVVTMPDNVSNSSLQEKLVALGTLLNGVATSGKKNSNSLPKDLAAYEHSGFVPFLAQMHLYQPLIHISSGSGLEIAVRPMHLNDGEYDFVSDLKKYCSADSAELKDSDIFLLRNKSKEGIGFFEAGNFYPDFIMWIKQKDVQHIVFIDPKGIRNLDLETDLKLNFYREIKNIEERMADKSIKLHSFIISNTPFDSLLNIGNQLRLDLEKRNILFQKDDTSYISKIIESCLR